MSNSDPHIIDIVNAIIDYQFGPIITNVLFEGSKSIQIKYSKNTGRIKHVYVDDELFLNYRPNIGLFTLTLNSAGRIIKKMEPPILRIIVLNEISEFIKEGRNVFNKHVVEVDDNLRPLDEVIVVNQLDELLGIGRLMIPVPYVRSFKNGIAVNIRKGINKSKI
ncbi:MAG: pseudouridine synthase [Promethearchaeota archaeon]|nr:MAG: pseudouridine synthase [Candidatus Lokiarchaeota archaeon]